MLLNVLNEILVSFSQLDSKILFQVNLLKIKFHCCFYNNISTLHLLPIKIYSTGSQTDTQHNGSGQKWLLCWIWTSQEKLLQERFRGTNCGQTFSSDKSIPLKDSQCLKLNENVCFCIIKRKSKNYKFSRDTFGFDRNGN